MLGHAFKLIIALSVIVAPLTAHADEITVCPMGGPTPGFRVIKFDLPQGSDFLGIEPHGVRQQRGVSNDSNWHLAQGIFIVNANTRALEAYRVESAGSGPRRVVVRSEGTTFVDQPTTAPDGPFYHTASRPRSGLPAGSYYAIGFGSDGGSSLPNEWWSGDVRVSGKHSCTPIGSGRVFDIDHTEFQGDDVVYAHAVGSAEDLTYTQTHSATADIVVGLMDAAVQGPGEASLTYGMPSASGTIEDTIVPYVSIGGEHAFEADFEGIFPMILIAGVAIDLP